MEHKIIKKENEGSIKNYWIHCSCGHKCVYEKNWKIHKSVCEAWEKRKENRNHKIASIHHDKSERFWNIWFKGAVIGGVYIGNKLATYRFKQSGARTIRRYELIREAMINVTAKKWKGGICTHFSRMASNILAMFCTVDPAYGTLFDEWIEEYNKLKKKEKIR